MRPTDSIDRLCDFSDMLAEDIHAPCRLFDITVRTAVVLAHGTDAFCVASSGNLLLRDFFQSKVLFRGDKSFF
jgi:hypothetical protein